MENQQILSSESLDQVTGGGLREVNWKKVAIGAGIWVGTILVSYVGRELFGQIRSSFKKRPIHVVARHFELGFGSIFCLSTLTIGDVRSNNVSLIRI